ncbi:MAG: hypothetical protein QM684_06995 [Rhizobium sp.]
MQDAADADPFGAEASSMAQNTIGRWHREPPQACFKTGAKRASGEPECQLQESAWF